MLALSFLISVCTMQPSILAVGLQVYFYLHYSQILFDLIKDNFLLSQVVAGVTLFLLKLMKVQMASNYY